MTLDEAAEKQYRLFCRMTASPPIPWEDMPNLYKDAWKEIVRTCPRKKRRRYMSRLPNNVLLDIPKEFLDLRMKDILHQWVTK